MQAAHDASTTGLGITFVSAVHAKVPVLLYDKSPAQIKSGLGLMDKILAKDVSKGKLTSEAAKEARDRVAVVDELKHFQGADLVIEVCLVFMCIPLQVLENALPQACSATFPAYDVPLACTHFPSDIWAVLLALCTSARFRRVASMHDALTAISSTSGRATRVPLDDYPQGIFGDLHT